MIEMFRDERVVAEAAENKESIGRHVIETHSTTDVVGRMAAEANVKMVVLNHLLGEAAIRARWNSSSPAWRNPPKNLFQDRSSPAGTRCVSNSDLTRVAVYGYMVERKLLDIFNHVGLGNVFE